MAPLLSVRTYGQADSHDDPMAAAANCTDSAVLVQLGEELERLDRYDDAAVAFRRAVELGSPANGTWGTRWSTPAGLRRPALS